MVKPNLSNYLTLIKYNVDKVANINSQLSGKLKPSTQNRLLRERLMYKNKIKHYLLKIKNMGQGTIILIRFRLVNLDSSLPCDEMFARYVNITKDEAKQLLELNYKGLGKNIEILEIKEIPTSIFKVEL